VEAHQRSSRSDRWALAGVALIAAGVIGFYAFVSGAAFQKPVFSASSLEYYPLLVDGFRAGRLGFNIDPPAALASLNDPYDPIQRQQAGIPEMHDVSYYKGRYYLYFGVAPAVTFFWPFRAITGVQFPEGIATILFSAGGYLCSVALFLGLCRRHFPATAPGWLWLGTLMLGFCNFCPAMLARNSVWEVPIASAYFYSCLGLLLLFKAESGTGRRVAWLVFSGISLGLSFASRPQFVLFCMVLACWWLWDLRRRWHSGGSAKRALLAKETAALFLPIAIIGVGLLAYNYARFGNVMEFGQKYQLGGTNVAHGGVMGSRFIPVNFYYYFLAPAQFQRYFPFVSVIRGYPGTRPADYGGSEDPFGILPNLPFCWLAFLAPLLWMRCQQEKRAIGRWLALFGLGFLAIAAVTLCFLGSTNRYMVDFLPLLLLAAAIGLLMVAGKAGLARATRRLFSAGVAAIVVYSAAFSALAGINHNGIFAANQPGAFAALARFFNRPVFAWEAAHPEAYGPAEITLRFPMNRPGAAEPILVTGVSYLSDYLYVVYTADGRHVQLGFSHTNHNQWLSQQIPVDYRVSHTIAVQMGSLYPARTHPYFSSWKPEAMRAAKSSIAVLLDGVPYLSGDQEFFDTTPGFVKIGENDVSEFTSRMFTGSILEVRRQPLPAPIRAFAGEGFLRLAIVLPKAVPGRRTPLVSTGANGRGDMLFVEDQDEDRIRFGFEHAGRPPEFSQSLAIRRGDVQLVETSLGSFYKHPQSTRERELAGTLFVRLDGQPVWVRSADFFPPGLQAPAIGANVIGDPGIAPAFAGTILAQDTAAVLPAAPDDSFAFAPYWIETGGAPAYGAIRLRLALAPQVMTPIESLVVTGPVAGQADYLSIAYPDARQVSFGYLHTGAAALKSRRILVDHKTPLAVELDMPSLYPSETDEFFAACSLGRILAAKKGWIHLKVNGERLIDAPVPHFESTANNISIGENKVSNVYEYAPGFTARILSIERARLAPPPGFEANHGPLEIVFTLDPQMKAVEGLLATGSGGGRDRLLLARDANGLCRISATTADGRTMESDPFDLEASRPHTLRIDWGGLSPSGDARHAVALDLDGKPLLRGRMDFQFSIPQEIAIGGSFSDTVPGFSGVIHSVRRLP